jgi:ABC-type Fe3+ transport system substrate-binding protein
VLLSDHAAARAFLAYLQSAEAQALIRAGGYRTP